MTRDLSLRGILSEWLREVVGIEGRLPRTLGKLFAHPGFLTRATLEGERDAYLSALKLFLVANLVIFLVGPYIGAVAFGLDGYLDERTAGSVFLRAFVERELLDLGMSAEMYGLRFDFTIAQHAPTFFFLMIPAIASLTKALLPSRLFGEHLVYATDFVAWVIVMILFGNIFMRVMGIPLDPLLEDPMVAQVATLAVVAALIGLTAWHLNRSLRTVFGLRGAGLWTRTVLIAASLVGWLYAYSFFLFWSTVVAVRLS